MKKLEKKIFNPNDVVFALDLDYTLAHYRNGTEGLFEVTRELGVSKDTTRQVLTFVESRNFSFVEFYRVLTANAQNSINENLFNERMQTWFKENYELYDDARVFLADYLERVPIVIVTAGDNKFQRKKIFHLGFVPDEVIVVSMGDSKLDALKDVFDRYQKTVIFVDDNPREFDHISFDAWFGFPSTSYRIRMRRKDGPHENIGIDQSKLAIRTFDQLRDLVPLEKEIA